MMRFLEGEAVIGKVAVTLLWCWGIDGESEGRKKNGGGDDHRNGQSQIRRRKKLEVGHEENRKRNDALAGVNIAV